MHESRALVFTNLCTSKPVWRSLVAQAICNRQVVGSNPSTGSTLRDGVSNAQSNSVGSTLVRRLQTVMVGPSTTITVPLSGRANYS